MVNSKEIVKIRAPVADRKCKEGFKWIDIEMLEPFSLIRYLWAEVGIEIGTAEVETFWREHRARGTQWAVNSSEDSYIPLGIYGDSCRVRQIAHQPVHKALGIFLNCPLFRPRNSRASRWLVCTLDERLLYKHITLNKIFARLCWSLNCLYEDRYPSCGPNGETLEGKFRDRIGQPITGHRFQVVECRGDWLWHKQVFRFNSSWTAGRNKPVCFMCPALSSGDCKYYNIQESSPLWQRQYTFMQVLRVEMPLQGPSTLAEFTAEFLHMRTQVSSSVLGKTHI